MGARRAVLTFAKKKLTKRAIAKRETDSDRLMLIGGVRYR